MRKDKEQLSTWAAHGPPESYIVRIYRRRQPRQVCGLVEMPETGARDVFHSFAELKAILGAECDPGAATPTTCADDDE